MFLFWELLKVVLGHVGNLTDVEWNEACWTDAILLLSTVFSVVFVHAGGHPLQKQMIPLLTPSILSRWNTSERAQQMVWYDTCQQAWGRESREPPLWSNWVCSRPPRFVWSGQVISKECLCWPCNETLTGGQKDFITNRNKTHIISPLWSNL